MPISLTTAASPHVPNSPGQETHPQYIFFNAQSLTNFSQTFTVNQEPWYLQAFNLSEGDTVTIQMATGEGSGTSFQDMRIISDIIQLTPTRNKLRLDWPGRYRLAFAGENIHAITVTGFPATMTHDTTSSFAEALKSLITIIYNGVQTIHVTPPINISGAGSVVDPYVIGITAASNAEMEAAVSVNEINASNLSYFIRSSNFGAGGITRVGVGAGANQSGETCVGVETCSGQLVNATNGTYVGKTTGSGMGPINEVVCVGIAAGNTTINADSVVFVGAYAGAFNSTSTISEQSTAIGHSAMRNGGANGGVFVGYQCGMGYGSGGGPPSRVTAIGALAAKNTGSGSDCIFVGTNAGNGETFTNVIVIGSDVAAVNATANNQIILGTAAQTQLVTAGSVISGGVIVPSDERLKMDIEAFNDGLEKVNMLRPVSFKWDETALVKGGLPYLVKDIGVDHYGFVAQELRSVIPTAIDKVTRKDTDFLFVHYDRLVPFLVSAIQELTIRVEALEESK